MCILALEPRTGRILLEDLQPVFHLKSLHTSTAQRALVTSCDPYVAFYGTDHFGNYRWYSTLLEGGKAAAECGSIFIAHCTMARRNI